MRSTGRYLHTFVPEAGESLGLIGFLRPAFGAIPPLAELQARWFALVQSGERCLPSREQMSESIGACRSRIRCHRLPTRTCAGWRAECCIGCWGRSMRPSWCWNNPRGPTSKRGH
jgi:hypothetical protein